MSHAPCDCQRCTGKPPQRAPRHEIEPGLFLVSTAGSGAMPPGAIRDTVRALCESADREGERYRHKITRHP